MSNPSVVFRASLIAQNKLLVFSRNSALCNTQRRCYSVASKLMISWEMNEHRTCSSLFFPSSTNDEYTIDDVLGRVTCKIIVSSDSNQFQRSVPCLWWGSTSTYHVRWAVFCGCKRIRNVHLDKVSFVNYNENRYNSRKELRTSYNIVFLVMTCDQGIIILLRDILVWPPHYSAGCGFDFQNI